VFVQAPPPPSAPAGRRRRIRVPGDGRSDRTRLSGPRIEEAGQQRGTTTATKEPGAAAHAGRSVSALASAAEEAQGVSKEVMRMADSSMNIDAPSTSVGSL